MSLVKCDGGQKDEGHRPDAVLTNLPNTSSSEREGTSGRQWNIVGGGGWVCSGCSSTPLRLRNAVN